jgi:gamma-glutamylcyclotransferase (GGCT)/AIG2-like uncharacterized protein YtfP
VTTADADRRGPTGGATRSREWAGIAEAGIVEADIPVNGRAGLALFVYGTLMFGEIVEELLGRRPVPTAAVATGWRVARLPGLVYPGLVPAPGRRASGLVLSGLSAAEWTVLDDFEGDAYVLCPVEVRTLGGGDGLNGPNEGVGQVGGVTSGVLTYAWRAVEDAEAGDWDPDWFASHWLRRYADRLRPGTDV